MQEQMRDDCSGSMAMFPSPAHLVVLVVLLPGAVAAVNQVLFELSRKSEAARACPLSFDGRQHGHYQLVCLAVTCNPRGCGAHALWLNATLFGCAALVCPRKRLSARA